MAGANGGGRPARAARATPQLLAATHVRRATGRHQWPTGLRGVNASTLKSLCHSGLRRHYVTTSRHSGLRRLVLLNVCPSVQSAEYLLGRWRCGWPRHGLLVVSLGKISDARPRPRPQPGPAPACRAGPAARPRPAASVHTCLRTPARKKSSSPPPPLSVNLTKALLALNLPLTPGRRSLEFAARSPPDAARGRYAKEFVMETLLLLVVLVLQVVLMGYVMSLVQEVVERW